MQEQAVFYALFLIFTGAAIVATLTLFTRQSLLVAYLLLGLLFGPWGLKLISNPEQIKNISEIGIVFLLFLLGLHLHPQNLLHMLRKVTLVALVSSLVFVAIGYGVATFFGFTTQESWIIGVAMMFSSTIIGLKLLPTTILHHQHTGEVMISVLLMQDLIAILVLLVLNGLGAETFVWKDAALTLISLPILIVFSFLFERYVLVTLLARFDTIQEYIFLLSIGWCVGMAELSVYIGLTSEIGAFVAGVALAASPIALYIADSLRPVRDFFLVLFFFSIGATFKIPSLSYIFLPVIVLSVLLLIVKPVLFKMLLRRTGESKSVSWEVGVRLGQASEFSLLVAYLATSSFVPLISMKASYLIQATTIFTFIVSSYLVVWKYPTPIAMSEKMRRD